MRYIFVVMLSFLLVPANVSAQRDVDFSGTWILDPGRSEAALPPNGTATAAITVKIAQTENDLRIVSTRSGVSQTARYLLPREDPQRAVGTAGRVPEPGEWDPFQPDASVGTTGARGTVVEWDGDTLVTITPHEINGMAVTTTERRTLSPDGREMAVVTQLEVQHGYQGLNPQNASRPSRNVYVRQTR